MGGAAGLPVSAQRSLFHPSDFSHLVPSSLQSILNFRESLLSAHIMVGGAEGGGTIWSMEAPHNIALRQPGTYVQVCSSHHGFL